jgi:hypothetical protein
VPGIEHWLFSLKPMAIPTELSRIQKTNILTKLNPWTGIILEKPEVAQLIMEFSVFYETGGSTVS